MSPLVKGPTAVGRTLESPDLGRGGKFITSKSSSLSILDRPLSHSLCTVSLRRQSSILGFKLGVNCYNGTDCGRGLSFQQRSRLFCLSERIALCHILFRDCLWTLWYIGSCRVLCLCPLVGKYSIHWSYLRMYEVTYAMHALVTFLGREFLLKFSCSTKPCPRNRWPEPT